VKNEIKNEILKQLSGTCDFQTGNLQENPRLKISFRCVFSATLFLCAICVESSESRDRKKAFGKKLCVAQESYWK